MVFQIYIRFLNIKGALEFIDFEELFAQQGERDLFKIEQSAKLKFSDSPRPPILI